MSGQTYFLYLLAMNLCILDICFFSIILILLCNHKLYDCVFVLVLRLHKKKKKIQKEEEEQTTDEKAFSVEK